MFKLKLIYDLFVEIHEIYESCSDPMSIVILHATMMQVKFVFTRDASTVLMCAKISDVPFLMQGNYCCIRSTTSLLV